MKPHSSILIVLILWIAGLCAAAQFSKTGLFLNELSQLYPGSGVVLGFIISAISAMGAVFGLFAGTLAVRIGLRRLLLSGLGLGSCVSLIQSFGLPLEWLMVSRLVEGASHLSIVVCAPTLIALNSQPSMRSTAMTLWGTFFGVAFALTALIGIPLVQARGIHALFLVHALLTGATAIAVLMLVPEPKEETEGSRSDKPAGSLLPSAIVRQHLITWRSPAMSAPAMGWFCYAMTFVALLAMLPGFVPEETRAATATLLPITSIIASMTLGVLLLRRFSAVRVVCTGFVLAGLTASGFLLLDAGSAIAFAALFAALGLVQGATFSSVPQLNPTAANQAFANGALAQAGNLGNALGTPVFLFIYAAGGFSAMISVVSLCYFSGFLVHWLQARRRRRYA